MMDLRSSVMTLGLLVACGGAPPVAATPPVASAAETTGTATSADGLPLYYRTAGSGEPTVVLVHCWGCSSDEWADAIPPLAANHRVIALDLAGHGRSGKTRKDWSVPAFAGDVRAVMDQLAVHKAILVGHSMSGPIAVEAAVEMPDRIVGIVPIDTLLDVSHPEDPAANAKLFAAMRANFPATVEQLVRSIVPKTADPAVIDRILAFEKANDPAIGVPVIEANWSFPTKDAFAKVKVPIISINADLFPTNVTGNQALAPQYQVRLIKGVGHWPMLEAPDRFNAMLVQAVAEITQAAK
jgi:pimeloyl-ACP methyl ester carboxylesterase